MLPVKSIIKSATSNGPGTLEHKANHSGAALLILKMSDKN